jgi:hypothetical protein
MDTAGGIYDEDLCAASLGSGAGVVECGAGISALLGLDDWNVVPRPVQINQEKGKPSIGAAKRVNAWAAGF